MIDAERFAATLSAARPWFTGFQSPFLLGVAVGISGTVLAAVVAVIV